MQKLTKTILVSSLAFAELDRKAKRTQGSQRKE